MVNMGVTETDVEFSMDTLYAENRKIVDSRANRYFFVKDPVPLKVDGRRRRRRRPRCILYIMTAGSGRSASATIRLSLLRMRIWGRQRPAASCA